MRRITNDFNAYDSVSLTADSTGLASVQSINNLSVWVAPNGEASRARQITSGVATNSDYWGFAWTPDRKILYVSTAGGNADIWMMDADGGDPKQLTANARDNFDPAVTPNGRYIVFASTRSGSGEIWRMDVDGGNPKQLTNVSAAQPQVSPDRMTRGLRSCHLGHDGDGRCNA